MTPHRFPRRIPARPHSEPVEREEYAPPAEPAPAPAARRPFATMPAPIGGQVDDDNDMAFPAHMLDSAPDYIPRDVIERKVRVDKRKY